MVAPDAQFTGVLGRVQALRSAPALRAPAAAWTRPSRARRFAFIGSTGNTELGTRDVGAMNRKSHVRSTPRPRRLRRRPKAAAVPRRMPCRPRTAEEVDRIYADAIDTIRDWICEKLSTLPPGSPNQTFLENLHDLPPDKLFEEILKASYPNPERVGCPPYRVLMELGTRRRGLDDPWFEHIEHCYPCTMELRPLVRAYKPPDPS